MRRDLKALGLAILFLVGFAVHPPAAAFIYGIIYTFVVLLALAIDDEEI